VAGGEELTTGRPGDDDDLYAVLEVSPLARRRVIDAAFAVLREIACADDSDNGYRMLVRLNRAHHVLSDPDRRAAYDAGRTDR
jgi:curved DNA-binding protein CbpA